MWLESHWLAGRIQQDNYKLLKGLVSKGLLYLFSLCSRLLTHLWGAKQSCCAMPTPTPSVCFCFLRTSISLVLSCVNYHMSSFCVVHTGSASLSVQSPWQTAQEQNKPDSAWLSMTHSKKCRFLSRWFNTTFVQAASPSFVKSLWEFRCFRFQWWKSILELNNVSNPLEISQGTRNLWNCNWNFLLRE